MSTLTSVIMMKTTATRTFSFYGDLSVSFLLSHGIYHNGTRQYQPITTAAIDMARKLIVKLITTYGNSCSSLPPSVVYTTLVWRILNKLTYLEGGICNEATCRADYNGYYS